MSDRYKTVFLFKSIGSFWIGMSTVFNLSGDNFRYNRSNSPSEADAKAIANDWGVVGNDIYISSQKFERENKELIY